MHFTNTAGYTFGKVWYPAGFQREASRISGGRVNSPIICVILAIDSWNYSRGEQGPTAQHNCNIAQSFLHSWTIYINEILLSPYVTHPATGWYSSSDSMKPYESNIEGKLLGLAVQSISSNSSAKTMHTIGELFTWYWEELQPNISARPDHRSVFNTYQWVDYSLSTGQHAVWNHGAHMCSNLCWKWCLTGVGNLAQSPACRMDIRE